eukprot:763891-Hanusia_phi.AAC.9
MTQRSPPLPPSQYHFPSQNSRTGLVSEDEFEMRGRSDEHDARWLSMASPSPMSSASKLTEQQHVSCDGQETRGKLPLQRILRQDRRRRTSPVVTHGTIWSGD